MKILNILFTSTFVICLSVGLLAQVAPNQVGNDIDATTLDAQDGPVMTFESMIVDYGSIEQNSDPLRVVKFTNTGAEPLVITNARGSCGCTVPSYPKQPIMPGETSQIEIRYDTKRVGKINKTVTITTNEGNESHLLKVVGDIAKAQIEEGVPAAKNSLLKPKKSN